MNVTLYTVDSGVAVAEDELKTSVHHIVSHLPIACLEAPQVTKIHNITKFVVKKPRLACLGLARHHDQQISEVWPYYCL
jgi:hypothetical protein